jgi:tetratricopeptide (TPR) repeat protein
MIKCRWASTIHASLVLAGVIVVQVSSGIGASAQIELAAINGTVTEESTGKPLPGVTITLKDLGRGRETKIKSDKDGKFSRRGLQAVDYEFTVQLDGYKTLNDKLRLTAGTDQRFDFKLAKEAPQGAAEFQKGVQAFNTGDAQTAILAFEDAVKKAPELPEVRVNLALAYLRASRTDDAIAQLEKAAAMAPNQPHILIRLGGVYVEARKNDKAIEALEKGLAQLPDLADPLAYDATVTLGAVYFAVGKNEQAIARFEKALAAKPGAAAPTLGLAKAFFSKGDVASALKHFEAVVASAPGTPEAAQAEAFIKELKKSKAPEQEA